MRAAQSAATPHNTSFPRRTMNSRTTTRTISRSRTVAFVLALLPLTGAAVVAWAALVLALAGSPAHAQDRPLLTPFSTAPAAQPPVPWRFSTLPRKERTQFDIVQQDGRKVLKVETDDAYGNLVHPVMVPLQADTTLAWRWRVDAFVAGADLHTRAGDDGAAKVCVSFDLPVERLSFGERAKLALARSTTGEDVPSETLCYVWDQKEPKGTSLASAFTQRIRMIVLESGAAAPGTWLPERRNLLADYRRVFGDEAGDTVPDVVAVAISADADNTHGHGLAFFSDFDLRLGAAAHNASAPAPARTPTAD